jgi:hypothetical protein
MLNEVLVSNKYIYISKKSFFCFISIRENDDELCRNVQVTTCFPLHLTATTAVARDNRRGILLFFFFTVRELRTVAEESNAMPVREKDKNKITT